MQIEKNIGNYIFSGTKYSLHIYIYFVHGHYTIYWEHNIEQLLNICKTKCFDEKSNFRIQITFSKSTSVHKTHYYLLEFLHNDNVFGLYLSDNELEKFIFFIKEVINIDII